MTPRPSAVEPGLDLLLVRAFQAYRQGLLRQPEAKTDLRRKDFDALKFLGTLGWIPLAKRLPLRALHLACGDGVAASRQGRHDTAHLQFEKSHDLLESLKKDGGAPFLLAASTHQAGIAYLDFREGRDDLARARLDQAMDADLELEKLGLPVMQIHRIQQGHNLVRMDLRRGRRKAAIELTGQLVAYLEGRLPELPFHRAWRPRALQALPRSLMRAMIHQIAGETAGHIVTNGSQSEEWRSFIDAAHLGRETAPSVYPQAELALRAERERIEGDDRGYLERLERFFGLGIRQCHLLWYPLVIDWFEACRRLPARHAPQLRDVIRRDSDKWKGIAPVLRECLEASPALESVAV